VEGCWVGVYHLRFALTQQVNMIGPGSHGALSDVLSLSGAFLGQGWSAAMNNRGYGRNR